MAFARPATLRAGLTIVHGWWTRQCDLLLRIGIAWMAVAAAVWLAYEFWRLLLQQGEWGAVDLRMIQAWTKTWFTSAPPIGLFPPASYPILWPLLGWLPFEATRWLWFVTVVGSLVWLSRLTVRESLASTRLERTVASVIPLAIYPTGAAIGNGQLAVHIMPVLLSGLLLVDRRQERSWRRESMAAILMLLALVKPTMAAPFFWIMIFVARSLRPAALVMLGYAALTWFALTFKDVGFVTVLQGWLRRSAAAAALEGQGNVANVNIWLESLGARTWTVPASLAILLAFGVWVHRHRRADVWLLLGVAGYVSRLWTYHRWYEDLLLLPSIIALFRCAKRPTSEANDGVVAGLLLVATMLAMIAPGGLFLFPPPWNTAYVATQLVVWGAGFAFLIGRTRESSWRERLVTLRRASLP
jgi:hypothetical protein